MTRRVDWFRVLIDLDRAGVKLSQVALRLDIPYGTLASYRNGGIEPNYANGTAIVALWRGTVEACGEVPMKQREMSAARAKV